MKNFKSLADFDVYLKKVIASEKKYTNNILEVSSQLIEDVAKNKFGHLQPAVGEFEKWDELAEATKRDKEREGYVFNDEYNPLFRTGHLRNSIHHVIADNVAVIGSDEDVMIYQEMGTATIPARAVLGPAAFESVPLIKKIAAAGLASWITQSPLLKTVVK